MLNSMSMQERLTQFLKGSSDWERKATTIPGMFLLKIPHSKMGTRKESIAIEINPINQATGSPIKKRGVVIMSGAELEVITQILTNPKLIELASMIDGANPPEIKDKTKKTDSDIIEI